MAEVKNQVEEIENLLRVAAFSDEDDPIREKTYSALGVDADTLDTYKKSFYFANEEDPRYKELAVDIKNKVFSMVAEKIPIVEEQGVSTVERFTLNNLFNTAEPELQKKFLEDQGYKVTQDENGELLVQKPMGNGLFEPVRNRIEPGDIKLDMFEIAKDIGDEAVNLIQGAISGGSMMTTLPVAAATGGIIGGSTEMVRQVIRTALGYPQTPEASRASLAEQTLMGTGGGALGYGVIKAAQKLGGGLLDKSVEKLVYPEIAKPLDKAMPEGPIKATYPRTVEAAKSLGIPESELLPSQKLMSREVMNQEGYLLKGSDLAGRGLRKQAESMMKKVADEANALVASAGKMAGMDKADIGNVIKSGVVERAKKILQPAEEIYESIEGRFKSIPIRKDDIAVLKEKFSKVLSPGKSIVKNISDDLDTIRTLDDLKNVRSVLGQGYQSELNVVEQTILNDTYKGLTDLRSNTLRRIAPNLRAQIDEADGLYAQGADLLKESLGIDKFKSGIMNSIEKMLEKKTPEQVVTDLFPLKNKEQLNAFAKNFPEQFDEAKNWYVKTLMDKSKASDGLYKGQLSAKEFSKNLKDIKNNSPSVLNLLFGEAGAIKAKAVIDFMDSLPPTFNPSDTGSFMQQLFSTITHPVQASKDVGLFKATLKAAASSAGLKVPANLATESLKRGAGILGVSGSQGILDKYKQENK